MKGSCIQCDIAFSRNRDLLSHLKRVHVTLPSIHVIRLPNTHPKIRRLLTKQRSTPPSDGLKLKLRSLGSEQFQVVQEQSSSPQPPAIRVLKPSEMKWDAPSANIKMEREEVVETPTPVNRNTSPAVNVFPSQDGFDQNNPDDILKKLLEEEREPIFHMNEAYNQLHMQPHPHQTQQQQHLYPQGHHSEMENEYISIDNLGNMCYACHTHFADRMELEAHKRITGHDMSMRDPPPLAIMANQQQVSGL